MSKQQQQIIEPVEQTFEQKVQSAYDEALTVSSDPGKSVVNWQTASGQLSHIPTEIADKLNDTGAYLTHIQNAALTIGDQATADMISYSWQNIERIALNAVMLDAARLGATEVIGIIEAARQEVTQTYTNLVGDIHALAADGDTNNPLLEEMRNALEEHWTEDGFHCDCPGCLAMEQGWFDVMDHDTVNDTFYALMSADAADVPPLMREELGSFLMSWTGRWDKHRKQVAADQQTALAAEEDVEDEE